MMRLLVLGLRMRVVLLISAAFALIMAAFVWHTIEHRAEMIGTARQKLLADARLLATRQQAIADRADALLTGLIRSPAVQPDISTKECSRLLKARLADEAAFVNLGWARPDGTVVCAAVPPSGPVSFADRAWFRQALQAEEMVVSDVLVGRLVGKPLISMAKAMRNPSGEVTGVAFLPIDLDWLQGQLGSNMLPEGHRYTIVDGTGTVVVRHPDPAGWTGRNAAQTELFRHVAASGEGVSELVGLDGTLRLCAYTPLLETASGSLSLWLSVPVEQVTAPARRELGASLSIALAVLLATLGLVYWGGERLLLRPLLALSHTVTRFGAGDLAARSGLPHTDDEIGRLARTLDETSDKIETSERKLQRANRALRVLSAGNRALLRTKGEQALLDEMCRAVVEAGSYHTAWVGYAEDDGNGCVRPMAAWGQGAEAITRLEEGCGTSVEVSPPGMMAVSQDAPTVMNDLLAEPDTGSWRELAQAHGIAALLALPLRIDGAVMGAFCVAAGERDAFDTDVIELLSESADDLAFGIETLRTRAERDHIVYAHTHHAEILQKSLEDALRAIAFTVEKRDPYTAGHERRVAELATAIAREMGLDEERTHGIQLAATVHDLGKIQVPAEILAKPGRLTQVEFMLIQVHPEAGHEILKDIEFPWPIADIVRQHHEKMDGSGYPQGLKDGDILLESRIMAVADVVEAMASHRPYRPALGIDKALVEIERGRGLQYDTAVADACLRLFLEKGFAWLDDQAR